MAPSVPVRTRTPPAYSRTVPPPAGSNVNAMCAQGAPGAQAGAGDWMIAVPYTPKPQEPAPPTRSWLPAPHDSSAPMAPDGTHDTQAAPLRGAAPDGGGASALVFCA